MRGLAWCVAVLLLALPGRASAQLEAPIGGDCGMSDATVSFGSVEAGSAVVLNRHSAWAGDDNWTPEMDAFVGMRATVTGLVGADDAGCAVVHVDADAGRFFWRVRDLIHGAPVSRSGAPLACDLPPGAASYGSFTVGSRIVLGRHTPWRGDANWAAPMDGYVGQIATITQLGDVDPSGCPGVRVDLDGGQFFWRVRDVTAAAAVPVTGMLAVLPQVVAPAEPAAVQVVAGASGVPDHCGMTDGTASYGPVGLGSIVVLGRHRPWGGDDNWNVEMDRWVGLVTRVTQLGGVDAAGCPGVRVEADGGRFFWRVRDVSLDTGGRTPGAYAGPAREVYPTHFAARPLTMARGMVAPYLEGSVLGLGSTQWGTLDLGLGWAPADFLELRANLVPLQLGDTFGADSVRGLPPWLELVAAYVQTRGFDMGLRFGHNVPFTDGSYFRMALGLPMRIHMGRVARIDIEPGFSVGFPGERDPIGVLRVGYGLAFSFGPYVFLGAESSLSANPDDFDDTFVIPLGWYLGATIPADQGPLVDLVAGFAFPSFAQPALASEVRTEPWQALLTVRIHAYTR